MPLLLDCAFEGLEREPEHLEACAKIAAGVYDGLDRLVARAVELASTRCLPYVNRIRSGEGSPQLTAEEFGKRMRLIDVCISPDDGVITLGANSYENEHNLVRIRFGPRGGLKEAYIE